MEGEIPESEVQRLLSGDFLRLQINHFASFLKDVYPDLFIDLINDSSINEQQQYNDANMPNVFLPTNEAWAFILKSLQVNQNTLSSKLKRDIFVSRRLFRKIIAAHVVSTFSRRGGVTSARMQSDAAITLEENGIIRVDGKELQYTESIRVGSNVYAGLRGLIVPRDVDLANLIRMLKE